MARTDRKAPDLSKAEPVETAIARLSTCDAGSDPTRYALHFLAACEASDIGVSVEMTADGNECLCAGMMMDEQEKPRRARQEELFGHLAAETSRRDALINYLNSAGRFVDNRRYDTAEEAVAAMLAVGGCILLEPDGELDEKFRIPAGLHVAEVDAGEGWRRKRVLHRYRQTLHDKAAAERVREIVRVDGRKHPGSGWLVLGPQDEKVPA